MTKDQVEGVARVTGAGGCLIAGALLVSEVIGAVPGWVDMVGRGVAESALLLALLLLFGAAAFVFGSVEVVRLAQGRQQASGTNGG